jgi:N-terminal region of glycosyl transferase group 7/N-terminal domain of galactosyltransferase
MKRLTIVVPYRGREEHLRHFVPHMRAYFARDKLDKNIPYRALIVEQAPGLPFNAGALKNIGFLLMASEGDYTCFHDVDYLPIWADYSWCDVPTPIVWYGTENHPIRPADPAAGIVKHALEFFFGGAILVPNELFRKVNGYSNDYWGWGAEDRDLRRRFLNAGVDLGRRKGTFQPLYHDHRGLNPGGSDSSERVLNRQVYDAKWASGRTHDGLSTLDYDVLRRSEMSALSPEREAIWEIVTVQLAMEPGRAVAT